MPSCTSRLSFSLSVSPWIDRKSTRLNSSHLGISYAVFCLKKKNHAHRLTHRAHQGHGGPAVQGEAADWESLAAIAAGRGARSGPKGDYQAQGQGTTDGETARAPEHGSSS